MFYLLLPIESDQNKHTNIFVRVKSGLVFRWEPPNFDCSPDQNHEPINTKLGKIDYLSRKHVSIKFQVDRLKNGCPGGVKYNVKVCMYHNAR
jgi:hypothetical protein